MTIEQANHSNTIIETPEPAVKSFWASTVSYLLHPLFLPSILTAYLVFFHPVYSLILGKAFSMQLWLTVTLNTVLYPALLVFLLWRLKFINTIHLKTQKERIIPLVVSLLFYFWAWYVSRNIETYPEALRFWLLGVFLCSCAAMFTNIYMKMSLHTLAWGGALGYCFFQQLVDPSWPPYILPITVVLAGIVGTARLRLKAHKPSEVYAGFLAGVICQVAAYYITG